MEAFTWRRRPWHTQEGRYRNDRGAVEVLMILQPLGDVKSRGVWPTKQITKREFTEEDMDIHI